MKIGKVEGIVLDDSSIEAQECIIWLAEGCYFCEIFVTIVGTGATADLGVENEGVKLDGHCEDCRFRGHDVDEVVSCGISDR